MEHESKRTVKIDPFVWDEQNGGCSSSGEGRGGGGGGISNVDKLRGYYDEARNRLRNYLGREEGAMGSGSSSPRNQEDGGGGGGGDGVGGTMFQQRPAHIRLEGKQAMNDEEFTDISYSDLGFIITPQTKTLTLNNNNNHPRSAETTNNNNTCSQCSPIPSSVSTDNTDLDVDSECDIVSTTVQSNSNGGPSNANGSMASNLTLSSNSPQVINGIANNNSNNNSTSRPPIGSLQHRGSDGSFTMSQLPGSANVLLSEASDKNLDDLQLEEILT